MKNPIKTTAVKNMRGRPTGRYVSQLGGLECTAASREESQQGILDLCEKMKDAYLSPHLIKVGQYSALRWYVPTWGWYEYSIIAGPDRELRVQCNSTAGNTVREADASITRHMADITPETIAELRESGQLHALDDSTIQDLQRVEDWRNEMKLLMDSGLTDEEARRKLSGLAFA